uniref:U25-Hexatoxin-Hc1dy_1 n=1 Tax=Hadronyche cerberea TaxID=1107879 RepID=A0A4Q8KBX4_HADCE
MLKFVVVIFLVIMASTFAQKCGDDVCDAGSCCVTYSQRHCKKLGQLHDMCSKPDQGTDSGNFVFFALAKLGYAAVGTIGHVKIIFPFRMSLLMAACRKCLADMVTEKHKGF